MIVIRNTVLLSAWTLGFFAAGFWLRFDVMPWEVM